MSTDELTALAALTFNWTRTLNDVWAPAPFHVEGLHAEVSEAIGRSIAEAAQGAANPLGVVIEGQRGAGKTHLLGWTREQAQRAGGYFFLVGDLSANAFWEELLGCVVEQLLPLPDGSRDQLRALLTALAERTGLDPVFRDATTGHAPPTPVTLKVFIRELRRIDPRIGLICQDTARALVLLASPLQEDQDVGYYFLTGNEVDIEDRRRWGIHATRSVPRLLITELSRLLALTGPTVIAIDQIDALIDELVGEAVSGTGSRALADMATGLMTLRDRTFRTLTIVSCLPESWDYILKYGTDTVGDRFNVARQLRNIPSAEIGRLMIEKRFAADYTRAGFVPPYPSWPILPAAFEDASHYTARALLRRVEAHVGNCLHERVISELGRLAEQAVDPAAPSAASAADDDFAALDTRFAELRDGAAADKAAAALHEGTEDTLVPALLAAGLEAWVRELDRAGGDEPFAQDPPPGKNPRLHASLRLVLDARTERQRRWAFRAIAAGHPRAVQSRLRKAAEAAGLDAGRPDRHLFVLRNTPWPAGKVTEQETAGLAAKGGVVLPLPVEDLKTFAALAALSAEHHPALNAWLQARQPAHSTELLSRALGAAEVAEAEAAHPPEVTETVEVAEHPRLEQDDDAVRIALPVAGVNGAALDLRSLRRHVAVFAGAGSGKTVLLKRIIEECALRGVSSIVLDPNNDLARLGEGWPEPPSPWLSADAERASDYLENTDFVVWTPRREGGRPLTFKPLPDFGAVVDDIDEFNAAVDAAVEALAPRVGAQRQNQRAGQEKAVLTEAMRYFARGAGHDLGAFIDLLASLPEHVSTQAKGTEIAAGLADRLRAIRVIDPLFGGTGEPADPGMLLSPPPGKRARVSVISMIGMSSLDQWQGFVNQLQMALFSWVKRNPAGDRPLGGLLVMDEAQDLAPATGSTPCSESTKRLASQARKYGLGLLFATQSPKGLHNSISNNATTQFFGLLNAPAQIEAARDLARVKGGDVPEIGRLSAGQFYLATEGSGFQRIRTPMCLSCHAGPLTEDEVLARAR
jgi:Helicase HerA, central domain